MESTGHSGVKGRWIWPCQADAQNYPGGTVLRRCLPDKLGLTLGVSINKPEIQINMQLLLPTTLARPAPNSSLGAQFME